MQKNVGRDARKRAIKNVCVIGAGVMGQAISAHMINAGIDCLLLDVKIPGDANQLAREAVKKIQNRKPSLLFSKASGANIKIGNIDDDLEKLKNCDLVIEAVVEKSEIKQALFKKIEGFLGTNTILASNTSGLSIKSITEGLSEQTLKKFLVMHFFNPVRYLHLLELVPGTLTDEDILERMINFGEEKLGKGVVVAKDTPNFIANRIGVYGMMEALRALFEDSFSVEEIDAVFGPVLGRPRSAIFRTADIVGLDTFIHVANNCYENLSHDECRETFKIPSFLTEMVNKNWLGQKAGQGFYKKEGDIIKALDVKSLNYNPQKKVRFDSLGEARSLKSLEEKCRYVANAKDRGAELFFKLTAKTCIYAANRLDEISDNIKDIDDALSWGFGWEMGPFKTWDAIGLKESCARMESMGMKVPDWVQSMLKSGKESFYKNEGDKLYVYDKKAKDYVLASRPERQWHLTFLKEPTRLIKDTDSYSLIDAQNGALIVEFHTKMNSIDIDVLNGINEAIDYCEAGRFDALVLGNEGQNFSVGANLLLLYMGASQGMWDDIDKIIRLFQNTGKRLKYSPIPTVAAPFHLTLGGGAELSMWCDHIHASAETYMGLVEVGVGLIPGGGGNIEMISRTLEGAIDSPTFVTEPLLMRALETVAMAKVATSAAEAKELLYLSSNDTFAINKRYHLHDAAAIAVSMANTGYIPIKPRSYRLPGTNAFATFTMGLRTYLEGHFISEHDYKIALKVAHVMTGGNTTSMEKISEDHLLDLEREAFLSLCGEQKTMERIAYMLEHNKPLRN